MENIQEQDQFSEKGLSHRRQIFLKVLKSIEKFEMFYEIIRSVRLRNQQVENQNSLLECLCVSVLFKTFVKLKILLSQDKNQLLITNDIVENKEDEEFQKNFQLEDYKTLRDKSVSELTTQMSDSMESIKSQKYQKNQFNGLYEDNFKVCNKQIGIISKLPIIKNLKRQNQNIKYQSKIFLGEFMYILRPLIYVILLRYYGLKNYKAYFISLIIDILRYLVQEDIKFVEKSDLEEFQQRNQRTFMNYIFRNPFYENIFKNIILAWILKGLNGKFTSQIRTLIFQIIDMSCGWQCQLL